MYSFDFKRLVSKLIGSRSDGTIADKAKGRDIRLKTVLDRIGLNLKSIDLNDPMYSDLFNKKLLGITLTMRFDNIIPLVEAIEQCIAELSTIDLTNKDSLNEKSPLRHMGLEQQKALSDFQYSNGIDYSIAHTLGRIKQAIQEISVLVVQNEDIANEPEIEYMFNRYISVISEIEVYIDAVKQLA